MIFALIRIFKKSSLVAAALLPLKRERRNVYLALMERVLEVDPTSPCGNYLTPNVLTCAACFPAADL